MIVSDGTMILNGTMNSIASNDTMFIGESGGTIKAGGTQEYVPEFMKHYQIRKPVTMPEAPDTLPKPAEQHPRNDFSFLKEMSLEELRMQLNSLDAQMEQEISTLRQRYQAKRQPILKAMDDKRQPT